MGPGEPVFQVLEGHVAGLVSNQGAVLWWSGWLSQPAPWVSGGTVD